MLVRRLGVEILPGHIGVRVARDEEVVSLVQILLVGVQRCLNGGIARAGNGACGQAADGVGVIESQHILRDSSLLRPAEILGSRGVPEIVVLTVLHNIARSVGFQLVLRPLRVRRFKTVVEAGADLGILAGKAGLLLNEAGQLDNIVKAGALGGDGIGQICRLGGKLTVELVHIVIDALIGIEVVGVGEQVSLALHQAVIVRDSVPEIILAPVRAIGAVGAGQEGVHILHKAGIDKDLGHAHGGRALGDRHIDGGAAGHNGQGLDDVIVGHAGLDLKAAVLDLPGFAAVLDILLEQPVILDNAGILELRGNAGHGGALRHGDSLYLAQRSLTVQLSVELGHLISAEADQRQNHKHDQAADRKTAAGLFLLVLLIRLVFLGLGAFFRLFFFWLRRLLTRLLAAGGRLLRGSSLRLYGGLLRPGRFRI